MSCANVRTPVDWALPERGETGLAGAMHTKAGRTPTTPSRASMSLGWRYAQIPDPCACLFHCVLGARYLSTTTH
jgi:hypothetical protein